VVKFSDLRLAARYFSDVRFAREGPPLVGVPDRFAAGRSTAQAANFPNLQPSSETISLRMPVWMLHKLKTRANQRGVPYQAHLKQILANSLSD
jgi:hypothetical protein